MLEVPWYMSFNEGYLFYVTGETYEPIKTDKGDSISKLFVILIVMCMAIIACTVIFLVNRRQKNIKEETDNRNSNSNSEIRYHKRIYLLR